MVICFKCSPRTKLLLDQLLETGHYADYSDLITTALTNFALLHEQLMEKQAVVIEPPITHASGGTDHEEPRRRGAEKLSAEEMLGSWPPQVPDIFRVPSQLGKPAALTQSPDDAFVLGDSVPVDRWLFGQFNKLLPAKASCRALLNLRADKDAKELDAIAFRIARDAALLGDYLRYHDRQIGLGRDDSRATAFPSTEENAAKSRLRYATQFVAATRKDGRISGLLIDLKLVNRAPGKVTRIDLTTAGWEFASLPNPVLDQPSENMTDKLSDQERAFLLDHIANRVPVEDSAFRTILQAVLTGANTPEKLDQRLLAQVTPDRKDSITAAFLATQRSGAVSRMIDLGLLRRERDQIRVSFGVSEAGKAYAGRSVAA